VNFETLFRRFYPQVLRYANRLTGDPDVAADVAQESFVRLLDRQLGEEEARLWLFTVATNLVRDGARKSTRRQRILSAVPVAPTPLPRPDEVAERSLEVEGVRAALEHLPTRDREMLLMREEGFSYAEIARAVGIAPGSVGTLLARALKRFGEAYGNPEGEG
jgi:RNA polymerase sigma-70 factor (ECF subfamily)